MTLATLKTHLKSHLKTRIEEHIRAHHPERAETRSADRGEEIRGRILDLAREQYMRLGFSNVTMDDIAAAAGVSKKTLYLHFPSKDVLVHTVAQGNVEKCNSELRAILGDESQAPAVRLRRMMDHVASIYAEFSVPLVHDMQRCAPQIWQKVETGRQKLIEEDFSALLKEGRARGDFRKDIDAKVFLLVYAEVVRHVLNPATFSRLQISPTRVFEVTCKILFEGLLTEKARKEYHGSI